MKNNRREFLKVTGLAGIGLVSTGLTNGSFAKDNIPDWITFKSTPCTMDGSLR